MAAQGRSDRKVVLPANIRAVIFDMDGVITDTANAHAASWKRLFDDYRRERIDRGEPGFAPFDEDDDYRHYVDGKPRYEGLNSFLQARDIDLEWGSPDDPPDRETVCGLGNRKNAYFNDWLDDNPVRTYDDSLDFLDRLDRAGVEVGIFSSSRNAHSVLSSAGIADRFAARTDGNDLTEHGFAGKPAPDMLVETARRLGARPDETAVLEDAESGVEAGRRGGFALVIGVDRHGDAVKDLKSKGAEVVVEDLRQIAIAGDCPEDCPEDSPEDGPEDGSEDGRHASRAIAAVESVWDHRAAVLGRLRGHRVALFLDYDGTLSPIVNDPEKADLPADTRQALSRLAHLVPLAVISGRGLDDVRGRVDLSQAYYAGSHGFELAGPNGWGERVERAVRFLPALDRAESDLRAALSPVAGARVERKAFSIAAHFRQVAATDASAVERAVDDAIANADGLTKEAGKKVFEIRPDMDWDKGHAVDLLLDRLGLDDGSALPIYVGDDVTDEDAFAVLSGRGLTVVVRGEDDERRTLAEYALADPEDVRRFLAFLADNLPNDEAEGSP